MVNVTVEKTHREIIRTLCDLQNEVHSLVEMYEVVEGKYPDNVLNEIRYAAYHLSLFYDSGVVGELDSSLSHMKRAKFDAYKSLSTALADEHKRYNKEYSMYDLSVVDNGEYVINVSNLYADSLELFKEAKKIERLGEKLEFVCQAWENACVSYGKLRDLITAKTNVLHRVRHRAKAREFCANVCAAVGIVGSAASIVSSPHNLLLWVVLVVCVCYLTMDLIFRRRR